MYRWELLEEADKATSAARVQAAHGARALLESGRGADLAEGQTLVIPAAEAV